MKEIKEISRMEGRYERGKGYRMFCEPHVFRVYKDKIFLGGQEDFKIEVLNEIYVLTYKKKEEDTERFVFNIDGHFIKKIFIPIVEDNLHIVTNPYVFGNGQLYQLIESENEEWEFHVHEL